MMEMRFPPRDFTALSWEDLCTERADGQEPGQGDTACSHGGGAWPASQGVQRESHSEGALTVPGVELSALRLRSSAGVHMDV